MKNVNVTVSRDLEPKEVVLLSVVASKSIQCVNIQKQESYTVDCKSVLGLLSLGIKKGDIVTFSSEDENILAELAVVGL